MKSMLDIATIGFFVMIGGILWTKDASSNRLWIPSTMFLVGLIAMFAWLLAFIHSVNPNWVVN